MMGVGGRWMTLARLGAQLGPLEHPALRRPPLAKPIARWTHTVQSRFPMLMFRPKGRVRGALFIAPGLHYAGPSEPRMTGFFESLARAGFLVGVPALPGFCALALGPDIIDDFQHAFAAFLPAAESAGFTRPGVFSISFGSLPALRLASSHGFAERVSGVITFGGFADWRAALRFSLTGVHPDDPPASSEDAPTPHDPLNKPVIFMNLLDALPETLVPASDRQAVHSAWFEYVRATWGREEMKPESAHRPVADAVAERLPPHLRRAFMMGCGLNDGGLEVALDALERKRGEFLDPRPHLGGLRGPLHAIHGVADDVIPYTEAARLVAAAPRHVQARAYLTGLYGHSRSSSPTGVGAAVKEGMSLLTMLQAIEQVAAGR